SPSRPRWPEPAAGPSWLPGAGRGSYGDVQGHRDGQTCLRTFQGTGLPQPPGQQPGLVQDDPADPDDASRPAGLPGPEPDLGLHVVPEPRDGRDPHDDGPGQPRAPASPLTGAPAVPTSGPVRATLLVPLAVR